MDSIYRTRRAERRVHEWCTRRLLDDPASPRSEIWELGHARTHLTILEDDLQMPTVVVIPGTNLCASAQLPFLRSLASLGPVVAPDVPGQPGLSSRRRVPDEPVSYLGAWLDELIDRLERPVVLVGHSLGAAIALAAQSSAVQQRVLLNPAGIVDLALPYRTAAASVKWFVRPTASTSRCLLRKMGAPGAEPSREDVEWFTLVGRTTWTSLSPSPLPESDLARAAQQAPSAVAAGRFDPFLPPERLRESVAVKLGTGLYTLESGHLIDHHAETFTRQALNSFYS